MDHFRFETPDIVAGNIEKIGALFPAAITEMRGEDGQIKKGINFEVLKQLLSRDVVDGDECYEFTWVGKKAAMAEAARPITKTLRPVKEDSRDWDTTQNLYIEGDNLEVLKILQESYLGKVKMIYIDPPYNTGHDFIYRDKFQRSQQEENEQAGIYDEEQNQMFENTESNGRFHSDWCTMIYPRLILARNLLRDDGVIFISIDDNECANLKNCCDEVLGTSNFVAQIVWEKVHTRKNSAINFSSSHEYILCYAKKKRTNSNDTEGFKRNLLPRDNTDVYSNPDNDPKGPWKTDPITAHNYYAADYTITKPNGVVVKRPQDRYWAYSEQTIKKMIAENAIVWGDGDSMPLAKRYLCDVQDGLVPVTLFSREFAGDTSQAKKQLDAIFEECKGIFDYTKPTKLITQLLHIGSNKEDIILDFFSGSATTADAIMRLNAEDGGRRKFVLVQWPEECTMESVLSAGFKNICEIGKERIRRAGDKIKADNPLGTQDLDTGFRVFRVDSSNMKDVYYQPEELDQQSIFNLVSNIKDDRTDLDLLYACLLDWGVEIHLPHTSTDLDGCTVHNVDNGALMACFSPNVPRSVVEYMAKQQPLRAVFRDSAFASDDAKINVTEIFKNLSPDTKVKVI